MLRQNLKQQQQLLVCDLADADEDDDVDYETFQSVGK